MNAKTQSTAAVKPQPSPQAGGRYRRAADGSITLLHQTKATPGRRDHLQPHAKKAAAAAASPSAAPAPGAAPQSTKE